MTKRKLTPDLPLTETPTPTGHQAGARKRAVSRSANGSVHQALGPIRQDTELFCLTNGQFSLIDVLDHCLRYTGAAHLDIATWTASDGDLRRAEHFIRDGRLRSIRLLVDPSFRTRKPEFCATLVDLFGNEAIRTIPLHGKFAVLRNDEWALAIRSSMNLNPNKRIENVEVSADAALAQFLSEFTADVFSRCKPSANFTSQSPGINATHDKPERRLVF